MRYRRHAAPPEDTHIDLAPMLDFFLNLLIFFIVSAAFVATAGIHVNKPVAKTAKRLEHVGIIVAISPRGEVYVDHQHSDIRLLRAAIEAKLREHPKASVVIEADRDARAGLVVEAMDQARLAGAEDVAVSATPQR